MVSTPWSMKASISRPPDEAGRCRAEEDVGGVVGQDDRLIVGHAEDADADQPDQGRQVALPAGRAGFGLPTGIDDGLDGSLRGRQPVVRRPAPGDAPASYRG